MYRRILVAYDGSEGARAARRHGVERAKALFRSILAARWFGSELPYGTLLVNLTGAFIIGLVQEVGAEAFVLPTVVGRLLLTLRG